MGKIKKSLLKLLTGVNMPLDTEEKGILRYLGNKEEEVLNLDSITKYLKKHGYEDLNLKAAREKLDHLIDVGYVRSKTEGKGDNREENFYLARRLGGGGRERKRLQGRGIIYDTSKLIKRLVGSAFLLIGFGFIIYESLQMTGAFISSAQTIDLTFIFAFALFIIGGFLLIDSFRDRR